MGPKRMVLAPLVLLQLRRVCLGFPGLFFVISVLALRWSWAEPAGFGGLQDAPLVRLSWALQQGVWLWVLWASLQLGLRIRGLSRKEANWLAPLGLGQGAHVATLWLGSSLATGLAMALLFGGLLGATDTTAPDMAIDRVHSWKVDASIAPGQALQEELRVGSSQQLAILTRPTVGAGPTTAALLSVHKGTSAKQSKAHIEGLKWLFVPIPQGPDPLQINLINSGDGQLGILGSRGLLTLSGQSAPSHWLRLALRAWIWTIVTLALVIAACSWLRPAFAIPLAGFTCIGISNAGFGPLSAWPEALEWQRAGMGPLRQPGLSILTMHLWLIACWLIARRGLHAWGIDR
ncbi:MAG: hypothetical protein JKY61_06570 [Planctomycetes bacterium]|nr:hypothetical protein [Planctomycetota bacterium]